MFHLSRASSGGLPVFSKGFGVPRFPRQTRDLTGYHIHGLVRNMLCPCEGVKISIDISRSQALQEDNGVMQGKKRSVKIPM